MKTFGRVVGLDGVDFDLYPGEVLAIIGDNGAGKSTLIKAATGAVTPDAGEIRLDGEVVSFLENPQAPGGRDRDGLPDPRGRSGAGHRRHMFLGREMRRKGPLGSVLRMLDHKGMRESAGQSMSDLGIGNAAEHVAGRGDTLRRPAPGGLGGTVAAFATKLIVLDEPTAALGGQGDPTRCSR